MLRNFFYVCAGMFLLALSYHLGASTAAAQIGLTVEGASIQSIPGTGGFPRASGCVSRRLNWMGENGLLQSIPIPVPGTQHIIATDPGFATVILENGDWLKFNGAGWTLIGNLTGGAPTPALRESWGQVKARYRPPVGGSVTPGAEDR